MLNTLLSFSISKPLKLNNKMQLKLNDSLEINSGVRVSFYNWLNKYTPNSKFVMQYLFK